ncbi:uncharacterized protein TNIN_141531 [Trichonephila inaurata madagascariensis]|uniref:STPR domain-containing protein n=1 Tax=Trichonephila inaurata madagascariensis TaxID=2747483 RepID=A0A8X7CMB3_9ARAC|nr:uncharacterized protein TNIN_141531 [Trichonephila inaurata madagascariensis]
MPKRKRRIIGESARRRKAIRKCQRRAAEIVEERNKRLVAMAQHGQERRAEETEEQRTHRLAYRAQRDQERKEEETEEQRSHRLAAMAQRDQERRAEETERQRSHGLSTMVQHARRSRVNVTEEQNRLQVQTFFAARTFLYPVVEEHNCSKMENICLRIGGLYFGAEKNAREAYTHCCHMGK